MNRTCIIITGPTGVGKTDYVHAVADRIPIEVVNADIGQMYTPLTIGTAKPDWRASDIQHHMFDICDTPAYFSAAEYRRRVISTFEDIWSRGNVPAVVGGSLFYIQSIFFPQHAIPHIDIDLSGHDSDRLWQMLHSIDPDRAYAVHPHDTYRVTRALAIWYATGERPSTFQPQFHPPGHAVVSCLQRERHELYERINARTHVMMDDGWIDEVRQLPDAWKQFACDKHILGYLEVASYINGTMTYSDMVSTIQKKTRAYAKRQLALWRSLSSKIAHGYAQSREYSGYTMALSLSDLDHEACASETYRIFKRVYDTHA